MNGRCTGSGVTRLLFGRVLVYIFAETMAILRSDFCGFASPSTQTPKQQLKLGYSDFLLPYTLHFILRRVRKIAKATIRFVMCLSVRQSARNNSAPTQRIFMKFHIWVFFENLSRRLKFHSNLKKLRVLYIKTDVHLLYIKTDAHLLYIKTDVHLRQYLAEFLKWEKFLTRVVQIIKIHILFSKTLFWKSCRLWDTVEKYGTAGQAADDNT